MSLFQSTKRLTQHLFVWLLLCTISSNVQSIEDYSKQPNHLTVLYLMGESAPIEWHQRFRNGFKEELKSHIQDFRVNELTYAMNRSNNFSFKEQLNFLQKKFEGISNTSRLAVL